MYKAAKRAKSEYMSSLAIELDHNNLQFHKINIHCYCFNQLSLHGYNNDGIIHITNIIRVFIHL